MERVPSRIDWIDCLKGIAISAVVLNHLHPVVYQTEAWEYLTAFAVPLFLLLSGITLSSGFKRHNFKTGYILKKFWQILFWYVIGSGFYHLLYSQYPLSPKAFLIAVSTFSASPPFYFFAIYLQLLIILPIIYNLFSKFRNTSFLILVSIFLIGLLLNGSDVNRFFLGESQIIGGLYIPGLMLGAKRFFGGTFLFMFSLGVYIFVKNLVSKNVKFPAVYFLIGSLGVILTKISGLEKVWANPPNFYTIFYSLSVLSMLFGFISMKTVFSKGGFLTMLSFAGKYSLFIYLLHSFFIGSSVSLTEELRLSNPLSKFLLVYICSLIGPILVFWSLKIFKKNILNKHSRFKITKANF